MFFLENFSFFYKYLAFTSNDKIRFYINKMYVNLSACSQNLSSGGKIHKSTSVQLSDRMNFRWAHFICSIRFAACCIVDVSFLVLSFRNRWNPILYASNAYFPYGWFNWDIFFLRNFCYENGRNRLRWLTKPLVRLQAILKNCLVLFLWKRTFAFHLNGIYLYFVTFEPSCPTKYKRKLNSNLNILELVCTLFRTFIRYFHR